ncbi:pyridoxamine 5'-phosphate oxidase family protein [Frigoribacterium sp. VKM Ac-2530]|uniref:pyridoxamine 5'-phosphate oxidase family protein n=1 Tax=Frigoribacterium sp. VKM Ac-2530 TaxID=2783822 RepID=UPI00188BDA63|nr:pyridoxamine 5'-phosphate oxidase family protein [Frigoribacterium sp. VKM Ac-2530]
MYGREDLVEEMTRDDCWRRLRRTHLGRLAMGHGPGIEIFPINYTADGQTVYLATSVGTKTAMVGVSPWVAFEIDGADDGWTWSVVVKGPLRRLVRSADLEVAGELGLRSAAPGVKDQLMSIDATSVTGRRFRSAL